MKLPDKPSSFIFLGPTGVGKCICADTEIIIKDKRDNSIKTITIEEFKKNPPNRTGKSLLETIDALSKNGTPKHIHIAAGFAAPEGIKFIKDNLTIPHSFWIGSVDERLNERFYIVPGLGDAGDLAFGPKI